MELRDFCVHSLERLGLEWRVSKDDSRQNIKVYSIGLLFSLKIFPFFGGFWRIILCALGHIQFSLASRWQQELPFRDSSGRGKLARERVNVKKKKGGTKHWYRAAILNGYIIFDSIWEIYGVWFSQLLMLDAGCLFALCPSSFSTKIRCTTAWKMLLCHSIYDMLNVWLWLYT